MLVYSKLIIRSTIPRRIKLIYLYYSRMRSFKAVKNSFYDVAR